MPITKMRPLSLTFMHEDIGSGADTLLWFDPWLSVRLSIRKGNTRSLIQKATLGCKHSTANLILENELHRIPGN